VIKAKLREKYRGLSPQELQDKAYQLGFDFEKNAQSCSQSVVAAFHELFEMEDAVVRVATSSCGGHAVQAQGTCGALIGGTMVLDYIFGRSPENVSHEELIKDDLRALVGSLKVAKLLYDRYVKEYGGILCAPIQVQLYGRAYSLSDRDELRKFNEAGAHSDPEVSCCRVAGNAARWVMEVLQEQDAIES
jgi:C_GCAxxG_C_C family probable redox protein